MRIHRILVTTHPFVLEKLFLFHNEVCVCWSHGRLCTYLIGCICYLWIVKLEERFENLITLVKSQFEEIDELRRRLNILEKENE
jgi:hypothetical protein